MKFGTSSKPVGPKTLHNVQLQLRLWSVYGNYQISPLTKDQLTMSASTSHLRHCITIPSIPSLRSRHPNNFYLSCFSLRTERPPAREQPTEIHFPLRVISTHPLEFGNRNVMKPGGGI